MERQLTFTEAAIGDGFRLDPEAGIAHGVAVCGPVSLNGRDYPDAVRDRDKAVYEGAAVYIDHADGERRVREWFGELRNPRTRISDRRTIADHHYPKNSGFTAEYEERAGKFPRSLGFSHVAVCQTKRVNGREVIEAITRVHSVDIVAKPATNAGIAESHQPQRPPMRFTAFAESVAAKWPGHRPALVKFLREEMGEMEMDAPPEVEVAGPDDPVKAAFSQAMHALVDQFDSGGVDGAGLLAKLKQLMKAAEKMADKPDAPDPSDPPAETESLKKQLADALRENAELILGDLKLSDVQRKAFDAMPTAADRKALVESFKSAAKSGPKSGEQNAQRKHTESTSVPSDGKAFAEFIR